MKKYIILGILIGFSLNSFAEELSSTVKFEDIPVEKPLNKTPINGFATLGPLGYGVTLEVRPFKYIAVNSSYMLEDQEEDVGYGFFGNIKDRSNSFHTGIRTYLFSPTKYQNSGLFLELGYKWSKHRSTYSYKEFSSSSSTEVEGITRALGYRFHRDSNWIADFALNYEPNHVVEVRTVLAGRADLSVKPHYDNQLGFKVAVGYNF